MTLSNPKSFARPPHGAALPARWLRLVFASRSAMAAVIAVVCALSAQAEDPNSIRFVALDKSGSMSGQDGPSASRFTVAVNEIRQMINAMPASADHPVIIVPFEHSPFPPKVYESNGELLIDLAALQAGGGTSIAAALNAVSDLLGQPQYADAHKAIVMIVTDGEDPDTQAILSAESELDRLFEIRANKDLSNFVFIKSWGASSKEMVQRWNDKGNADAVLIDGATHLSQILVVPALRIISTQRDSGNRLRVQVGVTMTATSPLGKRPHPVTLSCLSPRATGDVRVDVEVDGKEVLLDLKIDVSDRTLDAIPIDFALTTDSSIAEGQSHWIVSLSTERVTIKVTPPIRVTKIEFHDIQLIDKRWIRLREDRARFAAELVLTISDVDSPFELDVSGDSSFRLESTPRLVTRDGQHAIPVRIEADNINAGKLNRFELMLSVPPAARDQRYDIDPIAFDLEGPAPIALIVESTESSNTIANTLYQRVPFFSVDTVFAIRVNLDGVSTSRNDLADGLVAQLAVGNSIPVPAKLGDEVAFEYPMPREMFDVRYDDLSLMAYVDGTSVESVRCEIVLEREGFLPYLVGTMLMIALPIAVVYCVWLFRNVSPLGEDETAPFGLSVDALSTTAGTNVDLAFDSRRSLLGSDELLRSES